MEERVEKICKDCGAPFIITDGELNWLKEKGLEPFKRCYNCRQWRRAHKNKETNNGKQSTM